MRGGTTSRRTTEGTRRRGGGTRRRTTRGTRRRGGTTRRRTGRRTRRRTRRRTTTRRTTHRTRRRTRRRRTRRRRRTGACCPGYATTGTTNTTPLCQNRPNCSAGLSESKSKMTYRGWVILPILRHQRSKGRQPTYLVKGRSTSPPRRDQ